MVIEDVKVDFLGDIEKEKDDLKLCQGFFVLLAQYSFDLVRSRRQQDDWQKNQSRNIDKWRIVSKNIEYGYGSLSGCHPRGDL